MIKNKDLAKFLKNAIIGSIVMSAPVWVRELTEFAKDGGEYDLEDENEDNK